ncbi:(5-formylfuran-3-yl)methyl phosphate synthase [Halanaerobium sp. Z-7514]|uniref:(5-formylfuran-3-yl)methyl phosphate synthase n=1 Tax=Halanaerobium polyolivorans TaxID=2886943 RepID=A0AAW4WYH6_9FIRM|nr:(5-formylfuran-3-yl)methyl phosphate synthase [Halanaerobium polyolivorans]
MKLLISVESIAEAKKIKNSNFDILDIKNPQEGSLGVNFPHVIKGIRDEFPDFPLSAAGGDLPELPGLVSQVAFGLAHLNLDYIKLGLYGLQDFEAALNILREAKRAVEMSNAKNTKIIAAAYADFREENTFSPFLLNELAAETRIDGVMIDTLNKKDKNLFSFLKEKELKTFVNDAKKFNLITALAGSLKVNDLDKFQNIEADIIGFRGAVCKNDDRSAEISPEKIDSLYKKMNRRF